MNLRTILTLLTSGQLGLIWRLSRTVGPLYRASFLSAAATSGVLCALADGPLSSAQLAERLGLRDPAREAFEAWLAVGVSVGVLRRTTTGYALRSRLAKKLAAADQDAAIAMLDQVLTLHRRVIMETPERLARNDPFTLADQNGTLIARASRLAEPFVIEALDAVVPEQGRFRLLDVGCGAGRLLRHVCQRNPESSCVGLELQADVAEMCRRNLAEWACADRARIEVVDVRNRPSQSEFDLVTLHSLIYYFPWSERVELLARLRQFLKPDGKLLVTTSCQGSDATLAVLNLWGAMTAGCGRLPTPEEMAQQLRSAGFSCVESRQLIPGVNLLGFTAAR